MMENTKDKWAAAETALPPELRPLLKKLKADYETATKLHTKYKGGPNAGILSELIRLGWRKSN
jgi:hypothetical protein